MNMDERYLYMTAAEQQEARARANEIHDYAEERAAERAQLMNDFKRLDGEIDELYQDVKQMDRVIFGLVAALVTAVDERLDLSEQASNLERLAEHLTSQLGIEYTRREPALIGGRPLYHRPHDLIKIWLQRYEDWSKRGPVTEEMINAHGLQGSEQKHDVPNAY